MHTVIIIKNTIGYTAFVQCALQAWEKLFTHQEYDDAVADAKRKLEATDYEIKIERYNADEFMSDLACKLWNTAPRWVLSERGVEITNQITFIRYTEDGESFRRTYELNPLNTARLGIALRRCQTHVISLTLNNGLVRTLFHVIKR